MLGVRIVTFTSLAWALAAVLFVAWAGIFALTIHAVRVEDARWNLLGIIVLAVVMGGVQFGFIFADVRNRELFGNATYFSLISIAVSAILLLALWIPVAAGPVRRTRIARGWSGRWW